MRRDVNMMWESGGCVRHGSGRFRSRGHYEAIALVVMGLYHLIEGYFRSVLHELEFNV